MPRVRSRDGKEGKVAYEVSKEFTQFRMRAFGAISKMGEKRKDLPASMWERHKQDMGEALEPVLRSIYWAQTQTMVEDART